MTITLQSWEWLFGGFLEHTGPSLDWFLLVSFFCAAGALIWWSYCTSRAPFTPTQIRILALLRCALLAGLLLILANPARVSREVPPPSSKKPLAIMVDRSGSMLARDNRGRSRLDDALGTWKRLEPETHDTFSHLDYFSFASAVSAVPSLEAALQHPEPGDETRLARSLVEVLDNAPPNGYAAVVCITDGLDTTGATLDEAVKRAQTTQTPLYFLPCRNRLQPKPLLAIKEMNAPERTIKRTEFLFSSVINCYSPTPRTIPLALKANGEIIATTTIQASAGFSSYPWKTSVPASSSGLLDLELTAGNPGETKSAHACVHVLEKMDSNILLYQGSPVWGGASSARPCPRNPVFTLPPSSMPQHRRAPPRHYRRQCPPFSLQQARS